MLNSQWKIVFLPIFYPIFLDICHFKQLWKIAPFSTTIFSVSGEASPFPPCGRHCFTRYSRISVTGRSLIAFHLLIPYLLLLTACPQLFNRTSQPQTPPSALVEISIAKYDYTLKSTAAALYFSLL